VQLVLSLPPIDEAQVEGDAADWLFHKVAGVPLLVRVIATAWKSGCTSALLLHPKSLSGEDLKHRLRSGLLSSFRIEALPFDHRFDQNSPSDWKSIESQLEPRFLWLPWNYVADRRLLKQMVAAGQRSRAGVRLTLPEGSTSTAMPVVVVKERLNLNGQLSHYLDDSSLEKVIDREAPGWPVHSWQTARMAEQGLVRRSGKEWDGIYSKFNRWLCRPLVRWLSKTPITPNMVTFTGLPISMLSGYWFARGHWGAYVAGALLYFATVLVDEIDGMLARTTFRESAFGCWLESFVDYATYVPLFGGMTLGLTRQFGSRWMGLGLLLLFGTAMTCWVAVRHRKVSTSPDRPEQYLPRYFRLLEGDSGNILSKFVRQAHMFLKKGVLCHYVVIFSVLGALPVFFCMAVFGSNLAWLLGLYTGRLFSAPSPVGGAVPNPFQSKMLGQQYLLAFQAEPVRKDSYEHFKFTTEVPNVELIAPNDVFVPGTR
jgi:phosphatidylglycerophosphate synthase